MSNKRTMDSTFAADEGDSRFLDEHLRSSDQEVSFIPDAARVVFQGIATRSNPTRIVVVGEAITDALATLVAFAAFNVSDFGAPAAAAGAVVAALVWLGLLAMFRAYDPAGNVPLRSFLGAMGVVLARHLLEEGASVAACDPHAARNGSQDPGAEPPNILVSSPA